jgi:hypothetical protein
MSSLGITEIVDDIGLENHQKQRDFGSVLKREVKPEAFSTDPCLACLIDAWPTLPEVIKARIVEMIRAGVPNIP